MKFITKKYSISNFEDFYEIAKKLYGISDLRNDSAHSDILRIDYAIKAQDAIYKENDEYKNIDDYLIHRAENCHKIIFEFLELLGKK